MTGSGTRFYPWTGVLEDWVAVFRGPLVGLLASWGPDWRSAEELAQDTFAEAWIARERFRGDVNDPEAVGPWLRGIAFRLHAAARRRDVRARGEALEPGHPAPAEEAPDERRALLARAFALLGGSQQTVLRMFYLEQTGTTEVAALLGITPKALESRLYHARRELRAKLEFVTRGTAREVRA